MGKRKPAPLAIAKPQKKENKKEKKKNNQQKPKDANNTTNNFTKPKENKNNNKNNITNNNSNKNTDIKKQTNNNNNNKRQRQDNPEKNSVKKVKFSKVVEEQEAPEVEVEDIEEIEEVEEIQEIEEVDDVEEEEGEIEGEENEEIEEDEDEEEDSESDEMLEESDDSSDEDQYAFEDEEEDENVGKKKKRERKEGEEAIEGEEEEIEEEEEQSWVPRAIKVPNFTFDLQFHPSEDYIACSDVGGRITLYKYGTENTKVYRKQVHEQSCRCIKFSQDEKYLISGSTDLSLKATDFLTGDIAYSIPKAHNFPINALATRGNFVCTGDDEGIIKFWDMRAAKCVFEEKVTNDFISDIHITEKNKVVTTSADGQLSIYSLGKKKLQYKVDNLDDELLCLTDTGKYIVMGTQGGVLGSVKWGSYEELSRMDSNSHSSSVDAILAYNHNNVITGCADGIIRIVQIAPSKVTHVVGNHSGFLVEQMAFKKSNGLLASVGHDMHIKFWDINAVLQGPTVQEQQLAEITPAKSNTNATTNIFTNIQNTLAEGNYNSINYTLDNSLTTTVPELKPEELEFKPKKQLKKAAIRQMAKARFYSDL